MTVLHVPRLPAVVRTTGSLLSFASHTALGELGAPPDKSMVRHRKPTSQTWRTFLENHAKELVSTDFFVVPTATFRLLFVFLVLSHDRRRRLLHFGVTSHPAAAWTARQLVQAFPWDRAPRYLLRDRDRIYGESFPATVHSMGIHEVLTAPHSPCQNPYCERLIGLIRRECLDHFIIFSEHRLFGKTPVN